MHHILVVANQTIGGAKLLGLVKDRGQQPDTTFTLVVPMTLVVPTTANEYSVGPGLGVKAAPVGNTKVEKSPVRLV